MSYARLRDVWVMFVTQFVMVEWVLAMLQAVLNVTSAVPPKENQRTNHRKEWGENNRQEARQFEVGHARSVVPTG